MTQVKLSKKQVCDVRHFYVISKIGLKANVHKLKAGGSVWQAYGYRGLLIDHDKFKCFKTAF